MTERMTHAEFLATLRERFGESTRDWAFVCPACGDVATGADFKAALAERPRSRHGDPVIASDVLGQECIGRSLGALEERSQEDWQGRGCDWVAYGLIRGPMFVEVEGREVASFRIAPAPTT